MTFGIGEKHYGHRSDHGIPGPGGSHPTLYGWAGIEQHLLTYDVDRIQGYAEDIDTLLVFAGLFSSILSAFVVQTYQLLQQDSFQTTNQLIAFSISQFVDPAPIASVPAVSAAIANLLSPSSFSAPNNARWINALFFTSMVLSLAAALFGIRAKQWLRKYMQWNSPLNTPRDNILVRQIRVEAWESWNIDVTISFIPALLELAMVLFLAGIVVLLWTLDDIVAKAVTTIIAVFLLVIAAFTVLPIFFKRSPYKSPISWAFVAAANTVASLTASYLSLLRTSLVYLISGREDIPANEQEGDSTSSVKPSFLARLQAFLLKGVWISKDWENTLTSSWSASLSTWRERDLDGAKAIWEKPPW
ncbi:hypothetical protein PHLGIDRAFT_467705 [Phlebiopsis gigantea 11061_1 CR5-6]|uniref:DUF6535 domain-containing protein n=1 Tax=Phlebiopsis gigantea (strain 11061_1 CR5-6) TaxID=745531 RepID=A0A0C3S9G8_PHLG1|nr:hypothetical protein PHLGIDRAFT_467705 [Phlebiopsis gigantea 11061_1 CR5-6]